MSKIIGRFGGDAAQQRAEDFAREMNEKHPESVFEVEEAEWIPNYGFPRFENGAVIDLFVVRYG